MNQTLFTSDDYREFLQRAIERLSLRRKTTLSGLAQGAHIQPAYLTNALKGRAHLNQDQLYALAELLYLTDKEREFVLLLLEWERAQNPKRKKELLSQLKERRANELKTEKHLKGQIIHASTPEDPSYFLDPLIYLTHVFLQVPKYAKNPRGIRHELNISDNELSRILKFLENNGFIKWIDQSYSIQKRNRLLSSESPICVPHQILLRLKSLQRIPELPPSSRYNVSMTYYATPSVRRKIQSEFLEFLKKADELALKSKEDTEVFQMNFDLFPWSKPESLE